MNRALRISAAIITLAFALGAPAPALADFDVTSRQFVREIEPPPATASGYAYFTVDAGIYNGCSGSLKSLRIIDSEGREIPYQIVTKSKKVKSEEFFPKQSAI